MMTTPPTQRERLLTTLLHKGYLNYREARQPEIGISYLNSAVSELCNKGEHFCIERQSIELPGREGTRVRAKQYSIPEFEKERAIKAIDRHRKARAAEPIDWDNFKNAPLVAYFA